VHSLGVAEEWPVEGTKTKYILVALVVIVIVAASIGYYLIKDVGVEGITALEGKITADEIAKNWNSSAGLVYVMAMGEIYSDGRCEKWGYSYTNNNPNMNLSTGFAVTIYANGSVNSGEQEPPSPSIINDWIIDSDKAYEIARTNPEIKNWLREYHNANLQSLVLTANQTTSAWGIVWNDPGFMDDPHTSAIGIDASTGVVIDVYVQG
jgi:hypothetical protein